MKYVQLSPVSFAETELLQLSECIAAQTEGQEISPENFFNTKPDDSAYGQFVSERRLDAPGRLLLALAVAVHHRPVVLAQFMKLMNDPFKRAAVGGVLHEERLSFSPTLRTALFLCCGFSGKETALFIRKFSRQHFLFREEIILHRRSAEGESFLDQEILLNEAFYEMLFFGTPPRLDGGAGFPAQQVFSEIPLSDVILRDETRQQLQRILRFARHQQKIWSLPRAKGRVRRNFFSIFSGEPGTGKTLAAEAIGYEAGLPVYQVNLARLVSKYIGETEKNIERIFDRFSGHPCILFFDEAESIFSKRTEVTSAHDRYSNNEQSFLLQKSEQFSGIVILATNVRNLQQYLDHAFQRRVRLIVPFAFPDYAERLQIWQRAFPEGYEAEDGLYEKLARHYQLTGGSIYNIISETVLDAMDSNNTKIVFDDMLPHITEEFRKTGRPAQACTDEQAKTNPHFRFGHGYENRKI